MAMPQVDWASIKSFVQIPLSWFKEISRRSNIFSKHPLIIVERNNPDGIALNIDPSQLGGGENDNSGPWGIEKNSDGTYHLINTYCQIGVNQILADSAEGELTAGSIYCVMDVIYNTAWVSFGTPDVNINDPQYVIIHVADCSFSNNVPVMNYHTRSPIAPVWSVVT